ncbi:MULTISPECIES: hypothetical protein [Enterobacteriaceae]|jgi:hypothetical protein|uniref:hypothetical protein n=1 Tax=Enterobacteriaceae TaxID=543 RepID=UPI000735B202|nr:MULTISPECIES: hypothetical protein [Enterobacteriaceae]EGG5072129.1 hypothetical protein [Salmonella enterica]ELT6672922.1 hypothetical protein [Escherichia coli]MCL5521646.1 hypothetical protein [Citrobacter cronae]KTI06646.1 hypothetical protein ASV13_23235 [Enterobacter hormaechei subsp. steigerwaltii]RTQ00698.1 hypothetical protein EKN28_24120 [Enterobacter hormaechei]
MTDTNPTMLAMITRHQNAVEAFTAFASLHPLDDDLHPLIELLSANLEASFLDIHPHLCGLNSSNAKSGVPFQGSDLVIDDTPEK